MHFQWGNNPQNCPFPYGDPSPHLMRGLSVQPESTIQTASRSVHPFLQGSGLSQTDSHTDRHTDWLTDSVHAMRPNNNKKNVASRPISTTAFATQNNWMHRIQASFYQKVQGRERNEKCGERLCLVMGDSFGSGDVPIWVVGAAAGGANSVRCDDIRRLLTMYLCMLYIVFIVLPLWRNTDSPGTRDKCGCKRLISFIIISISTSHARVGH